MFAIIYIILSLVSITTGCYILTTQLQVTKTSIVVPTTTLYITISLIALGFIILGFAIHSILMTRAMKVVSIRPRRYIKVRR